MNIIQTINDKYLFRPFLQDRDGKLESWSNWKIALKVVYGRLIRNQSSKKLILECTGRDYSSLPKNGFDTALFLTGRRSGKSRNAAVIAGYEALFSGKEKFLSPGEIGLVPVISPTKLQSQIVKSYIRALFNTPMLEAEIEQEDRDGFQLSNKVRIQILVGDFRSVRGFTLLACVVDEAAFFGLSDESKVRSDTELIRAIKPSLATVGGRLIVISSPYAKKGWCFTTHKRNFGNNKGRILVWNCPSRVMNPTLPQSVIDDAVAEDLAAAKSEYFGEFRDDVACFLPREVIETCVINNRKELMPQSDIYYCGFVDVSGGRHDDAAVAIAHKSERKVIIDFVRRYKPPHSPYKIIGYMVEELRRFRIRHVTGDNYSAEFVKQAFESKGIRYEKSKFPKSQLYLELLPRLCSGEIELLDDDVLINQLSGLERRTRSGGRDIVDHPTGGHDDVSNVVSGVSAIMNKTKIRVGAFGYARI